jgi:UDP-N-acetylglucosamine 4,6-dehydratase
LITGGTGYLGRHLVYALLEDYNVTVLSRNMEKQAALWLESGRRVSSGAGDICNVNVLDRALDDVDGVIHAAALVRGCESNVDEAIRINVKGTQRLVEAAKDRVDRVLLVSTSAACNPSSVYGATKLLAERIFLNANQGTETRYSAVRLGNLVGSGVVSHFKRWRASNEIQVTDPRMTRFWITAEQAVSHVLRCLDVMEGGEIFVPKQPSASLGRVIRAVAPDCKVNLIGPQPGESMDAMLVAAHEGRYTDDSGMFVIRLLGGCHNNANWEYNSRTNPWRLTCQEIKEMVDDE